VPLRLMWKCAESIPAGGSWLCPASMSESTQSVACAVVVTDEGRLLGVITASHLLEVLLTGPG
jgi:CBS domain-containing protein